MTKDSVLDPAAQDWIGKSVTYPPFPVTRIDIAKYCYAVGISHPTHFDSKAARAAGYPNIVAPLGYHMVIRHTVPNLVPMDELFHDGGGPDLTPPSRASRRMAGASSMDFKNDIFDGDTITLTKTIRSLEEKVGRSGPLAFVTYDLVYRDAKNITKVVEQYVRIIR